MLITILLVFLKLIGKPNKPDLLDYERSFGATCLPVFHAGLPLAAGSYCEIPMTFLQLANMANEEVVMGPGSGLTASDIHAAEAAAYAATPASGSSERSCDTLTRVRMH